MKTKILILVGLAMLAWLVPQDSSAATVPAGTILIVQTLNAVSSTDAPGTRFAAQLANSVTVNGKVILPSGTKLSGKIETSKRLVSSSQRLTVNLTDVQVGGRAVSIKTTGARPLSNDFKTRRGVDGSVCDQSEGELARWSAWQSKANLMLASLLRPKSNGPVDAGVQNLAAKQISLAERNF